MTKPQVPPLARDIARTAVGRFLRDLPIKYFHATMDGVEHLPREGGALLVGNHAFTGVDGAVLGALIIRETGRLPRFLGDRNLFRAPIVGPLLTAFGALEGEPHRARELLEEGELVVVYPGGVDDSFKLATEKHRLKWGSRAGFAKVAMRAKVPIVPVAAVGIDEMYDVLGREHWLGRWIFGSTRYDLPIAVGAFGTLIPRRAPQAYHVLAPVETRGDPESKDDVERVRAETFEAIDAVLSAARTSG